MASIKQAHPFRIAAGRYLPVSTFLFLLLFLIYANNIIRQWRVLRTTARRPNHRVDRQPHLTPYHIGCRWLRDSGGTQVCDITPSASWTLLIYLLQCTQYLCPPIVTQKTPHQLKVEGINVSFQTLRHDVYSIIVPLLAHEMQWNVYGHSTISHNLLSDEGIEAKHNRSGLPTGAGQPYTSENGTGHYTPYAPQAQR